MLAATIGCRADPDEVLPHGPPSSTTSVSLSAAPEGRRAPSGDPLLTEAEVTMQGGRLPDALLARLLASEDPRHARARRLFEAMTGPAAPPERARTTIPLLDPGNVQTRGASRRASRSAPRKRSEAERKARRTARGEQPRAVATLTSLRLDARGAAIVLVLRGSHPLEIGTATGEQASRLRVVVDSAGALPAVLATRPHRGGVAVESVRRGESGVVVTLRFPTGWRVGHVTQTRTGSEVLFSPP